MGLIVRRNENLERMFDALAVDPKKKAPKQPDNDKKNENSDKKKSDKQEKK